MYSYNKYYKKLNYFGEPYPELIELFGTFDRKMKILDLGCGQGRDSLAIARLGFEVVGIDLSDLGLEQMNNQALAERLSIKGIVSDYKTYPYINNFDIILLDSMFHFYKNDVDTETQILNHILNEMKDEALIVIIMEYNESRMTILNNVIINSKVMMKKIKEQDLIYKEFNSKFRMILYNKTKIK